eukprot:7484118-Pyramimonas_sp.AAC.1
MEREVELAQLACFEPTAAGVDVHVWPLLSFGASSGLLALRCDMLSLRFDALDLRSDELDLNFDKLDLSFDKLAGAVAQLCHDAVAAPVLRIAAQSIRCFCSLS